VAPGDADIIKNDKLTSSQSYLECHLLISQFFNPGLLGVTSSLQFGASVLSFFVVISVFSV